MNVMYGSVEGWIRCYDMIVWIRYESKWGSKGEMGNRKGLRLEGGFN